MHPFLFDHWWGSPIPPLPLSSFLYWHVWSLVIVVSIMAVVGLAIKIRIRREQDDQEGVNSEYHWR